MSYTALNPADIVAGKPTKEELFQQIRTNQEDFDARIDLLQGASNFNVFDVNFTGSLGDYSTALVNQRCPVFKAPAAGSIISIVITLLEASTSGTLEMDIQKSTDNGITWNSVLSAPAELTGTAVGSTSTSGTFVASGEVIAQNDLFRIQFTNLQTGQGDFHVSVYAERS